MFAAGASVVPVGAGRGFPKLLRFWSRRIWCLVDEQGKEVYIAVQWRVKPPPEADFLPLLEKHLEP